MHTHNKHAQVCLTVVAWDDDQCQFDVMEETRNLTNLSEHGVPRVADHSQTTVEVYVQTCNILRMIL